VLRGYATELRSGAKDMLVRLGEQFAGPAPDVLKTYAALSKQLSKPMEALTERLLAIGQLQVGLSSRARAHAFLCVCVCVCCVHARSQS
jgi:hypothetical protein